MRTSSKAHRLLEERVEILRNKLTDMTGCEASLFWAALIGMTTTMLFRGLITQLPQLTKVGQLVGQAADRARSGDDAQARLVFSDAIQALGDFIADRRQYEASIDAAVKRRIEKRSRATTE